jgi:hypothetical protein
MTSQFTVYFTDSAFKHEKSQKKIKFLLSRNVDRAENKTGKVAYLCLDENLKPYIILFNRLDINIIKVFHCRKISNENEWLSLKKKIQS